MHSTDNFTPAGKLKKIDWAKEETPAHWLSNDPILTHLCNAYIIVTAEIERFTIKYARLLNDKIEDKSLKLQWDDFIQEEISHAYQHVCVSNDLKRHQYPVKFMTAYAKVFFFLVSKIMGTKSKIAFILAMEFYAHQLAIFALESNLFPENKSGIYDFLRWHAKEELSHLSLCLQMHHYVKAGYIRRITTLLFFTFFVILTTVIFLPLFFFIDITKRRNITLKNIHTTLSFLFRHKGLLWKRITSYAAFFNPRFQPRHTPSAIKKTKKSFPYFDCILSELTQKETPLEESFGKHVHWGYWPEPSLAKPLQDNYYLAAKRLTEKMSNIANITNGKAILDVGCGFGGTISELNDSHSDMMLTGLNIDSRQLERAKQQVRASHNNQINFIQGNACTLPFADNQFDNILAIECIFHFHPGRAFFFQEACRVLKPGGRITLSDFIPNPLFLPHCWIMNWPLIRKFNFFGYCNIRYTLKAYRYLASQHNLEMEVLDITTNTLPTYPYLNYLSKKIRLDTRYKIVSKIFTTAMPLLAKMNLLSYQILSFRKRD